MPKTLSTKMRVAEVDRFEAMAKRQGVSKSQLLRRLVEDHMNGKSTGGEKKSTGSTVKTASSGNALPPDKIYNRGGLSYHTGPLPTKPLSSEARRSQGSVSTHLQYHTFSPAPAPVTGGLGDMANEGHHSDSLPSPKESLPVYQSESKGRRKASAKSSIGKGWRLLLIPAGLWLKSHTSIVPDGKSWVIVWH